MSIHRCHGCGKRRANITVVNGRDLCPKCRVDEEAKTDFPRRVQVAQTTGPNRWAEARERRPSSNPDRDDLVKVVYEGSRTSAWVTEPRIYYGPFENGGGE